MKKINWKEVVMTPANTLVAITEDFSYESSKMILVDRYYYGEQNDYVVLEGGHCSCYDYDDVEWEAISYTSEEIKKLAEAPYNADDKFWTAVRNCL